MGVQHTVDIKRENAEKIAVQIYIDKNKNKIMNKVKEMNNQDLEDYIEEQFYNYKILS